MKNLKSSTLYKVAIVLATIFVVSTVLAMFAYPGGRIGEPDTTGYDFFSNFFSDLGRTRTYAGGEKTISLVLFVLGLTSAGLSLLVFNLVYIGQFKISPPARFFAWVGSGAGVLSSLAFIAIAYTPADLQLDLHIDFVFYAFRLFLLSVVAYLPALFLEPGSKKSQIAIFIVFALLLASYIALLTYGPSTQTPTGLMIQATSQKIIVYASILSILAQSWSSVRAS